MGMKPQNRLHSATRWPSNPRERLELADTDIEFCAAMMKIEGRLTPELDRIAYRGYEVGLEAMRAMRA